MKVPGRVCVCVCVCVCVALSLTVVVVVAWRRERGELGLSPAALSAVAETLPERVRYVDGAPLVVLNKVCAHARADRSRAICFA